jgi:seryl-tRNA synthetase
MLDPKLIRNDLAVVAEQMKKRGIVLDTARLTQLEEQRKAIQIKTQDLQNTRNVRSKAVGQAVMILKRQKPN